MVVPPRPRPPPPPPPSSRPPPPPPAAAAATTGGVDDDDKRHKREEAERRKRRKAAHLNKSEAHREKNRKIKEHRQRVLRETNKQYSSTSTSTSTGTSTSKQPQPSHKHSKSSSSSSEQQQQQQDHSAFAALFADRTGGFVMEFKFRNAPPRPPVGPCFVGLGLEGELQESWTKYVPNNAVERNFAWKLHAEPDLGVPLAPSAMDWHGCYTSTSTTEHKKDLAKEDEDILNWKGSMGDSAADELQLRREQARRADAAQQSGAAAAGTSLASSLLKLKKRNVKHSRVLEENRQFWMKKTTYLDNDRTKRVHDFRSLAQTKQETFVEIDAKLKHTTTKLTDVDTISKSFILHQHQTKQTTTIKHPTRPHLTPVFTYPLLPDVSTWGHDFTHVVLDQTPKPHRKQTPTTQQQLEHALIANVTKLPSSNKMSCDLLVPKNVHSYKTSEPTNFDIAQIYDLDVVPLKEEEGPHAHFALFVDHHQQQVTYHPITSRVQLSTGRPVPRKKRKIQHLVTKRALNATDVAEMEARMAEVDQDCANKRNNTNNNQFQSDNDDDDNNDDDIHKNKPTKVQTNSFFDDNDSSSSSDESEERF